MEVLLAEESEIILMQCNTNYTASANNLEFINLNVLKTYAKFSRCNFRFSDHTHGCTTVLGSIALGARVIEKHFTDSCDREGPDHKFSMDPTTWREMVERSRELESSLGNGLKVVEENEKDTVVLQRRSLRATEN